MALIIMSVLQSQLSPQRKLPKGNTYTETDRHRHTHSEVGEGERNQTGLQFRLGPAGFLVPGPSAWLCISEWSCGQEEILSRDGSRVLGGWVLERGLRNDEALLILLRAWPKWLGPRTSTIHFPTLLQMLKASLRQGRLLSLSSLVGWKKIVPRTRHSGGAVCSTSPGESQRQGHPSKKCQKCPTTDLLGNNVLPPFHWAQALLHGQS